jgi:hypothetical protein
MAPYMQQVTLAPGEGVVLSARGTAQLGGRVKQMSGSCLCVISITHTRTQMQCCCQQQKSCCWCMLLTEQCVGRWCTIHASSRPTNNDRVSMHRNHWRCTWLLLCWM